jgi:nitrogen-specific signal transduction histidine kinase/ActR/RegA family two-component response regulator
VALATHQAQLYASLQSAFEELRQTQHVVMQHERLRAVGEMASGIAHDINNALSPAALYVQSLLEQETSPEARNDLAVIQRSIDDVARTIARMREFSRPRERELVPAPVNLNEVLQQVADVTRARWSDMPRKHGIVVRMDTDFTATPPIVMGAENEIRDAFTNLVLNAVDALPTGGTVTLRSRIVPGATPPGRGRAPDQVQIEVCDTGVGMSEATRSRCLEPFFTTKGERGTGLGLAMVYGMAQRHGATLEVRSELDEGTTMSLTFPSRQITSTLPRGIPHALQPLRILFVDDDPVLLRSLQVAFERDGHAVSVADGGQTGIDTFVAAQQRGEGFAVVVTDLGMAYVDGRTVAAAIKEHAPITPVILLTGWGHRMNAENEFPEHVDRVLSKPPNLGELRTAIAQLTHSPVPRSSELLES